MSLAPVCVPCGLFFKNKRNGVVIEERMPVSARSLEGREIREETTWVPYKLWHGDLKECEGCGSQIVVGFGTRPLVEHYEHDYAEQAARETILTRVDDCGGGPFNAERAEARRALRRSIDA